MTKEFSASQMLEFSMLIILIILIIIVKINKQLIKSRKVSSLHTLCSKCNKIFGSN